MEKQKPTIKDLNATKYGVVWKDEDLIFVSFGQITLSFDKKEFKEFKDLINF